MNFAIIGAGVAGLAAARELHRRRPDLAITLYEQAARPGGRVLTGRRPGFAFEHGAQNLRAPTAAIERLLAADLAAGELRDIGLPVWTFDRAEVIGEGDPAQNAEPKWIYVAGNDRLVDRLTAGLDIRANTPIERIERSGLGWRLYGASSPAALATASAVLVTSPAPEAARLLSNSDFDSKGREGLLGELARASYRRCISIALACNQPLAQPFYALVNIDRAHPISWLALEHAKGPEHCPPGHSLLVAQMGARWSIDRWQAPDHELAGEALALAGDLLGETLIQPLWSDVYRWPYALPDAGADFETLNSGASGLFFAGDYTAALGRVHLAIESGWRAAEAISQAIEGAT
jgi:renalase